MKPRLLSTARLSFPLASALAALAAAPSAHAVDFYWDGVTGNWTTATDWSTTTAGTANPVAAPASTTAANLFFNITSKNTATSDISLVNGSRSAASLTFNTTGTTNFRAGGNSAAASTLNIGAGGITINALAGSVVLGVTPTSFGNLTVALAADQTWTNNGAGTLTVNGAVTGGAGIDLTKSGTGIVRLNGLNTYVGTTTVNNGVLQIANYDALDTTSSIIVSGGGTSNLQLIQVGTGTTTNSINKALSLHGTLSTGGGTSSNRLNQTWVGNITLAGASTITNNGNSLFDIDGQVDLGAHTLTYQADGTGSRIDGKITGTGGLTKTSNQDLTIANTTNDYSGTTTVTGGTLTPTLAAALSGYTVAGKVIFNGGTIRAAMGNGSTTGWSTAQVDALLSNATKTSGVLGIDTTNGNITQWTAFTTTNFGPALGLSKFASNTLTLDQANTYTGATSVFGGVLRLANTSAVAGSSSVTAANGGTIQLAADAASTFTTTALSLTGGTLSSDRLSLGMGLTHILGNAAVSNSTQNFTGGSLVNDGNAGIQLGNITNASGANGSVTFNPSTANLTIAGGYTGLTNGGVNGLILGGTAATNSLTGDITLGSRTNINVSKTGNSVWTLSGNNSVSLGAGSTLDVSGGALIATTLAALPNSGAATFSGGTIGARVGAGGWTTGEVDTFLAAGTTIKTSGALGIDTSIASQNQWTDFTTTNLGALGFTKLGTNTLTLNSAANNYTGTTLVSQGTLEMTVDHTLTGGLTFGYANGTTSATGTLDLNNVNASFGGLSVDGNSPTAYGIQIDSGKSLTINGNVVIGAITPGLDEAVTKLAITGGGEFISNGTTFLVGGSGSTTLTQYSTLDLTGLSKATFTTTGNFRIAPNTGTNIGGEATLLLPTAAVADTVATTTFNIGAAATRGLSIGNGGSLFNKVPDFMNTLQLGTGLTTINTPFINVASNPVSGNLRDVGQLIYQQANIGDLIIRGADGTSRAGEINLGVNNTLATQTTGASALTAPVLFDTSGHDADILLTSLNMGGGLNRTGAQEHVFKFGEQAAGVGIGSLASKLDVTNVNIGNRSAANSSTAIQIFKVDLSGGTVTFGGTGGVLDPVGTGVDIGNSAYDQAGVATFNSALNISGGTTTIHNGSGGFAVRLGQSTAANSGIVNASMNLTGGTTTLKGDIVKGTATGTVNSTLTLNGASAILDLDGNDITNVGITYTDGTLKNLGTVNTGITLAGTGSRVIDQATGVNGEIQGAITGPVGVGITKDGTGKLTLSGTGSTYSGDTLVSAGTLFVTGSLTSDVTVSGTSTVGGGGTVGDITFGGGSFFDIFLPVDSADSLASTTISFAAPGFGIDNLVSNGLAVVWGSVVNGTYTLITGTLDSTNLGNFGLANAYDLGGGRSAYFQSGSLQLVVIPEPNVAALLGGLGTLCLLRRRRN